MSKKYFSLSYDCVFKYLFGYSKNVIFTEKLLEALLDLEDGALNNKIKIINSLKLEKDCISDKNYEVDILVEMPDGNIVNLEAYRDFDKSNKIKSFVYLSHMLGSHLNVGEEYIKIKNYEQYNLVKNNNGNLRSYIEYKISDTDLHAEYLPNVFKINIIRVDKVEKELYNISDKLKKWLMFINAESLEEAEKITRGDKILMEALNRLNKFFSKEENCKVYDKELLYEARLNEKMQMGRAEEKVNTAKNMLKDNADDSIISKYTGLTKEEIAKIKMTLN